MRVIICAFSMLLAAVSGAPSNSVLSKPFLKSLNSTTGWVIGNGLWNITIGDVYGTKLLYEGQDLIGKAVGHYSGYGMLFPFTNVCFC